jgi:hypothetical protein
MLEALLDRAASAALRQVCGHYGIIFFNYIGEFFIATKVRCAQAETGQSIAPPSPWSVNHLQKCSL